MIDQSQADYVASALLVWGSTCVVSRESSCGAYCSALGHIKEERKECDSRAVMVVVVVMIVVLVVVVIFR